MLNSDLKKWRKIYDTEKMIKILTYKKWDFIIVRLSLTLKTFAALNFYDYLNCVRELLYFVRN